MPQHPAIAGIPVVLGGNVFGWTAPEDEGFAVLDAFYEAGGRMIDTADVYSAWVPGHRGGESERMIGRWLETRGVRGDVRIHTKTGMLGGKELYEPATVLRSLDASLERLRTDVVDLYYAHIDYKELPIDQIVAAFDGAIKTGKVRSIGASKFSATRLQAALDAADAFGATRFTALQNRYNLVERDDYPPALQRLCCENSIAMFPFFGLANGFLTGKYRSEADLAHSSRGARVAPLLAHKRSALQVLDEVAAEAGASQAAVALAWLRVQPAIAAPIASARKREQVDALVESANLQLDDDQLARLSAAG